MKLANSLKAKLKVNVENEKILPASWLKDLKIS